MPEVPAGGGGMAGGCTYVTHGRSRMTIDPRIPEGGSFLARTGRVVEKHVVIVG